MTALPGERLYALLPTYFRQSDLLQGYPLRALLDVLGGELGMLEGNMAALYSDWFIETCADWVVPYIGDLLGVAGLGGPANNIASQRVRVANTIAYHRRKGTRSVLEQVLGDVSGWPARVVVFSRLTARYQNVQHPLLGDGRTVDLRDVAALGDLNGPFDSMAHTVDVRRIPGTTRPARGDAWRGRSNLPNAGIYVWRLAAFPTTYVRDAEPSGPGPGAYFFNPFGLDSPLLNRPPDSATADAGNSDPSEFPIPLTPMLLSADLAAYARRYARSTDPPDHSTYYGPDRAVWVTRDGDPVHPLQVASFDLSRWAEHGFSVDWHQASLHGKELLVDVVYGRMLFKHPPVNTLQIRYHRGSVGDIGGGPYDRRASLVDPPGPGGFVKTVRTADQHLQDPLRQAIQEWNEFVTGADDAAVGLIRVADDGLYQLAPDLEPLTVVLPRRGGLTIQADSARSPAVAGSLRALGQASSSDPADDRYLRVSGLLIDGDVQLERALRLELVHSTLVPRDGRLGVSWQGQVAEVEALDLRVLIDHSIVGPLRLPAQAVGVACVDSVVDARGPGNGQAIAANTARSVELELPYGPPTTLTRATMLGEVWVRELGDSRDTILTGQVRVQRTQVGSLAFCYVAPRSTTPRRFRCQPDLALADGHASIVLAHVRPVFTSTVYAQPAYAQLGPTCPEQISTGGEGGSEMGAFCGLAQPARNTNIHAALREYLNAGLDAGVFYAT